MLPIRAQSNIETTESQVRKASILFCKMIRSYASSSSYMLHRRPACIRDDREDPFPQAKTMVLSHSLAELPLTRSQVLPKTQDHSEIHRCLFSSPRISLHRSWLCACRHFCNPVQ